MSVFNWAALQRKGHDIINLAARAVTKATFSPAYTEDNPEPLSIDKDTGKLLVDTAGSTVTQGDLDSQTDAVAIGTPMGASAMDEVNDALRVNVVAGGSISFGSVQGSLTDRSDSITTGSTSQEVMAANAARRYLTIINLSDYALWIDFGVDAAMDSPSIPLPVKYSSYTMEMGFISTQAVNIICATAGAKFVAKEG